MRQAKTNKPEIPESGLTAGDVSEIEQVIFC